MKSSPKVAVLANDALGNFVVSTPILQLIRTEWKASKISFIGGTRSKELQDASDLIDQSYALFGSNWKNVLAEIKRDGPFDIVVNLENSILPKVLSTQIVADDGWIVGPALGLEGRADLDTGQTDRGQLLADQDWQSQHLMRKYPFLRSGFISEIFARLCFFESELPSYHVTAAEPRTEDHQIDVIFSTSASLIDKLWQDEKWVSLAESCLKSGFTVGVVGAAQRSASKYWKGSQAENLICDLTNVVDLRGKLSLPEVVGQLSRAKKVFCIDSGIMHLSVAVGTDTVALFREGIHRLWAPPSSHLTIIHPGEVNGMAMNVTDIPLSSLLDCVEN